MAAEAFDFVVVGGGSAGAVIASRLSEDPSTTVALVEAGGSPPAAESMPAAVATLQLNPETDWMYTADAGKAGRGLTDGRMMMPRGRMLGGSSGINYMAYVRGHPGDFDAWAAAGGSGWSYSDVLAYFKKSEGLAAERRHRGRRRRPQHDGATGRLGALAGDRRRTGVRRRGRRGRDSGRRLQRP